MRDFYAGLIAFRHADPVVRHGRFELLGTADAAVAFGLFGIEKSDRSIIVAINAGDQPARLELELPDLAGRRVAQVNWPGDQWGTTFAPRSVEAGRLVVEIEAREGLVLRVGRAR